MSPTSPRLPATTTAPPFKVHRASHLIHKEPPAAASSSSSSSNSGLTTTTNKNKNNAAAAAHRPPPRQQHKQQQPVIIYTHSPKVIRTNPRDFMSIVQKLTGLDSAPAAATANSQHDSSSSSSSSSADSCTNTCLPPPLPTTHHFMPPEIPLFAPAPASDLPPLCAYAAPFAPVMSSPTATATVFSPDVPFPHH